MNEDKKQFYINLLFAELVKQFNENIKGKTQKHLEHYLRETYKDWFFWNYVTKVCKQEKEIKMVYVERLKKNISFETFIGDEFTYFLNKKVGSKKRHGSWDFLKICNYLNYYTPELLLKELELLKSGKSKMLSDSNR